MRVIDENFKRERIFGNAFHASGNAGKFRDIAHGASNVPAESADERERAKHVAHVVIAGQMRFHGKISRRTMQRERAPAGRKLHVRREKSVGVPARFRIVRFQSERHGAHALRKRGENATPPRIVGVDDCRARERALRTVEKPAFHGKIIFHVPVIIHVVLRQIRERDHGKRQRENALLVYRVRADFHRRADATGIAHFRKKLRKVERFGRRFVGRHTAPPQFITHGADKSPRRIRLPHHQKTHERSDACFAVRSRDADERQRICGIVKKFTRDERDRFRNIGNDRLHDFGRKRGSAFPRNDCDCAARDGVRRKINSAGTQSVHREKVRRARRGENP